MSVLKQIKFGTGSHDIAKTIVQGKPEGVISVSNTSDYNNTVSEEKDYSYDIDVNIDGTTIVKDGETTKSLKVGTVPAAQVSVADSGELFKATDVEAALAELKGDIADVGGAAKSYTIIEKTTDLPTNVAHRYKLQQTIGKGATAQVTEVGENIDILKDNSLLAAKLSTIDATWDAENKVIVDGTGKQALVLVYQDANGTAQVIAIDVSAFLDESEFKDGLAVSVNGEVSAKLGQGLEFGGETGENQSIKVKIDSTSTGAENFLSVGADGVKISGVQDAIDNAIDALDFSDTEADGQYVSKVDETDGKISVERKDVSGAKLNNYAKGSVGTAVAATDTINEAFSKIEVRIDNNEQVTSAALNNINAKIERMDKDADVVAGQVVTTVSEADGVVNETKSAVKDLQLGGYAKDANATGAIAATDTINAALSKLENNIAGQVQYKVSGTTLEFFGMTAHA